MVNALSYLMVPEVYQVFWSAMTRGEFITDAAAEAGGERTEEEFHQLYRSAGLRLTRILSTGSMFSDRSSQKPGPGVLRRCRSVPVD